MITCCCNKHNVIIPSTFDILLYVLTPTDWQQKETPPAPGISARRALIDASLLLWTKETLDRQTNRLLILLLEP